MNGKGSDFRPHNKEKFNENFDRIFGKRSARQVTKVTIEFDLDGSNHTIDEIYTRAEQLIKSKQLKFDTATRYDWNYN